MEVHKGLWDHAHGMAFIGLLAPYNWSTTGTYGLEIRRGSLLVSCIQANLSGDYILSPDHKYLKGLQPLSFCMGINVHIIMSASFEVNHNVLKYGDTYKKKLGNTYYLDHF